MSSGNDAPKPALQCPPEKDLYRYQVRDATHYAMFFIEPGGTLLSWNAGVETLLGYTQDEWLGRHASLIFTPAERAHEVCTAELEFAEKWGTSSDMRWHVRKDGSRLFAHGFMTAIRENGKLVGFSKILSDETKSKQLQDSLTESNEALEQFAYVASHDLQEPLRTVGAYTELLASRYKGKFDADSSRLMEEIVKGAKRMSSMVQDLLFYARVQTEVDRPSSFALDDDIETALTQLRALIEETHAVVTHDSLPVIEADQGQMVRLFQNLIGNSLKYRKPDVPPSIHVAAERQGASWVISVKDNGIGFDPKEIRKIFLPFKRLHGQGEYPGNGVGLAICKRIVEQHGGRIWAESVPGEGATFYFSLPAEGKPVPAFTPPVQEDLEG